MEAYPSFRKSQARIDQFTARSIASGLALNDNVTLLAGAIPAAALALLVQGTFELVERRFGWLAWVDGSQKGSGTAG